MKKYWNTGVQFYIDISPNAEEVASERPVISETVFLTLLII